MPSYDYHCKGCGEPFEIVASMSDSRDDVTCPHCQSAEVARVFAAVGTIGGKGGGASLPSLPSSGGGHSHGGGCGCSH